MFRRLTNIFAASAGLIIAALPMAAISAATAIESGFPIIYKHKCYGKNGRPFTVYKFKTLINASDESTSLRPTKVGTFLRKTNLNELPQFINIIKGDMCLIGPRPWYFKVPEDCQGIYDIKPGLFGISTVTDPKFRIIQPDNEDAQRESCELEIEYNKNRTIKTDIIITKKMLFGLFRKSSNPEPKKHYDLSNMASSHTLHEYPKYE